MFNIELPQKFTNVYYQSYSLPSTILVYILSEAKFKTKLKLYQTCKQLGLKFKYKAETLEYSGLSKSVVKIEDAIIPKRKICAAYSLLKVKSIKMEYEGYNNTVLRYHIDYPSVETLKISTSMIYFTSGLSSFLTSTIKKIDIQQCLFAESTEYMNPLQMILNKARNLESITFGALNIRRPYEKLPNVHRIKKLQDANFIVYHQVEVEIIINFVETQMAPNGTLKLLFHIDRVAKEFVENLKLFVEARKLTTTSQKFTFYSNLYSVVFQRI